MLKAPKYEIDMDNQKVWLRLALGDNGEVNHFLDALMMKAQMEQDADLMTFCGHLKAHERFYKNDLVTDFNLNYLGQFLQLLTKFVDVSDPYDLGEARQATPRTRRSNNIVDADIVDNSNVDTDNGEGEDI